MPDNFLIFRRRVHAFLKNDQNTPFISFILPYLWTEEDDGSQDCSAGIQRMEGESRGQGGNKSRDHEQNKPNGLV